jgi:hypothetical protein
MDWGTVWERLKQFNDIIHADLVELFGNIIAWQENADFSAGFWVGMFVALIIGGLSSYVVFLGKRVNAFFEPAKGERPVDIFTGCITSIIILSIILVASFTVARAWVVATIN